MAKKEDTINKIQELLDGIRPYLYMDGGDVEFVDYKDKHMFVQSLRHGDYVISVAKETNRSEEPEIVEVESL